MTFTNLTLGTNWSKDEWPDHVDVMHEGAGDSLKYVPEHTCRDLGGEYDTNYEAYDFGCSECGYCCDLPQPNYCPNCGAEVMS